MNGREGSLYGWAFVAGKNLIERFEYMYGAKRAEKRMEDLLLTLRSELLPEKFRRTVIDYLIEVKSNVRIPEEIRLEKRWNVDEFYRYSTAILSGFFDALNWWREQKSQQQKKEQREEG